MTTASVPTLMSLGVKVTSINPSGMRATMPSKAKSPFDA
jgi:hypothetical protein